MRQVFFLFSGIIITTIFSGCAGAKELQTQAPVKFTNITYKNTAAGTTLYLPVTTMPEKNISLKSVYFRTQKTEIEKDTSRENVYLAKFIPKDSDNIMSIDPKDEYGNTLPRKPEEVPFKITKNEAILVYKQGNRTRYYKLTGITERN